MYTYIHTYIHTYTHTQTPTYLEYTHIHTHRHQHVARERESVRARENGSARDRRLFWPPCRLHAPHTLQAEAKQLDAYVCSTSKT